MRIQKTWCTITFLLMCLAGPLPARAGQHTVDPALATEISRLLDLANTGDMAVQIGNQFLTGILEGSKKLQPGISEEALRLVSETFLMEFQKGLSATGTLRAAYVAMYAKHFTREDIAALIAFYETDTGRKSLRVTPMLVQDSGQIAREWLKANAPAISRAVQARLKEAGLPEFPR